MIPVFIYKQKTYYRLNTRLEDIYAIAAFTNPFRFYCETTMEDKLLRVISRGSKVLSAIGLSSINAQLIEEIDESEQVELKQK